MCDNKRYKNQNETTTKKRKKERKRKKEKRKNMERQNSEVVRIELAPPEKDIIYSRMVPASFHYRILWSWIPHCRTIAGSRLGLSDYVTPWSSCLARDRNVDPASVRQFKEFVDMLTREITCFSSGSSSVQWVDLRAFSLRFNSVDACTPRVYLFNLLFKMKSCFSFGQFLLLV